MHAKSRVGPSNLLGITLHHILSKLVLLENAAKTKCIENLCIPAKYVAPRKETGHADACACYRFEVSNTRLGDEKLRHALLG